MIDMNPVLENVVFDLGGVLVDLDLDRCVDAFKALGMPRVAELVNPYYPAEMLGRLEKGELTFHETCERMRRLDNRPEVTDGQIADAYTALLVDVPVAKLRLLESLRRKGLKTYVLSNNNPASMEVIHSMFLADGHPMEYYFDRIYLSYEMHELKPSPEIFRQMIADSGMNPDTTLFIDDGKKNIDTARDLGFQVYMPAPREDLAPLFEFLTEA